MFARKPAPESQDALANFVRNTENCILLRKNKRTRKSRNYPGVRAICRMATVEKPLEHPADTRKRHVLQSGHL